jgi:hypothetical protein
MNRMRIVLASAIATALTVTTLAAPAAAASNGRIIFAQGMPGVKAELCINNKEMRSVFKYGQAYVKSFKPGAKAIKLRKAAAGKCTGKILARKTVNLQAGQDITVAFSKFGNKTVVFPDYTLTDPMVLRHGGDLGIVEFRTSWNYEGYPWVKAGLSDTEYDKGDWASGWTTGDNDLIFWANKPSSSRVLGNPFILDTPSGWRHEAILVGAKNSNARWIHVEVKDM